MPYVKARNHRLVSSKVFWRIADIEEAAKLIIARYNVLSEKRKDNGLLVDVEWDEL
jgi:hypothetical protein